MSYPKLIEDTIVRLVRLPGIGRRSAERMVFWLLNHTVEDVEGLARSLMALKRGLMFCQQCHHLTETEMCSICVDSARDRQMICVVEDPKDVLAIERTGSFRGHYHVLLGSIAPAEGRGPDDLTIQHLLRRVQEVGVKEVVIATDADNEGEMTALYLIKQLKPLNVIITRIGLGLPVGGAIEYADISSLSMSLTARREV